MNKILLFLVFLVGCGSADSQSCDLCGKWSFDRFEYVGHITTDCEGAAQNFYKNAHIKIDVRNFTVGEYDLEENAQELFVKIDDDLTEKFYVSDRDSMYVFSDGCRFYFKRD